MGKYIFFIIVLTVFTSAGCSEEGKEKAIQKQIETATGGTAQVDIFDDNVLVTGQTEEGPFTISTGENIGIPDDFPPDIPIYQPSKAIHSTIIPEGRHFVLSTPDDVGKVIKSYRNNMVSRGWNEEEYMDIGQDAQVRYSKGKRAAQITIYQIDNGTQIILMFGKLAPSTVPLDEYPE